MISKFWKFGWGIYHKNEEIINYLIVGVLTTIISYISFIIPNYVFKIDYVTSEVISWIIAVLFAYFTNKSFVFKSKRDNKKETTKEAILFFISRIVTLIIGILVLYLLIDLININEALSKFLQQIVIFVLNYVFSKIFVFKKD